MTPAGRLFMSQCVNVLMLVTMVVLLLIAVPATALSCAQINVREDVENADAAMVGTLESVDGLTYRFAVEKVVKGRLGATVEIVTYDDMDQLSAVIGWRGGLLLQRVDGRWRSGKCSVRDPEALLAALGPLAPPTAAGTVAYVVGGAFGEPRTSSLDDAGRLLAYGLGAGYTIAIDVCPGARTLVEVAVGPREPTRPRLAVRDVATMAVKRELALPDPAPKHRGGGRAVLTCRDPNAHSVLVYYADGAARHVVEVAGDNLNVLWANRDEEPASSVGVFHPRQPVVYVSVNDTQITAVDLTSGGERPLAAADLFDQPGAPPPPTPTPGFPTPTASSEQSSYVTSLAVSPDGSALAAVIGGYPVPGGLMLIDLAGGPAHITRFAVPDAHSGDAGWVDDKSLAVGLGEHVVLYDRSLQVISTVDLEYGTTMTGRPKDNVVTLVSYDGRLQTLDVGTSAIAAVGPARIGSVWFEKVSSGPTADGQAEPIAAGSGYDQLPAVVEQRPGSRRWSWSTVIVIVAGIVVLGGAGGLVRRRQQRSTSATH